MKTLQPLPQDLDTSVIVALKNAKSDQDVGPVIAQPRNIDARVRLIRTNQEPFFTKRHRAKSVGDVRRSFKGRAILESVCPESMTHLLMQFREIRVCLRRKQLRDESQTQVIDVNG